ncbi:nicotinate-nucleotide adenylyltransferase [Alteribacillus sp. HJP-4]|uniref:nicotinate-nucleotide adenylyltransferase n=1 Tax=Alteribacillus sp. HJP-4 TaxID=2775394 RepID=UPI0035CCD335
MKERIGLLGGTFDPPHQAHLIIAQEAMTVHNLDEVWFIPVSTPPHKVRSQLVSGVDRLEMTRLLIQDNARFFISDIELNRRGLSYTVDTVRELRERYPGKEYFFIIGADMAEQLNTWENIEELKTLITFIVSGRPGYAAQIKGSEGILHLDAPLLDISSTDLRSRITNKQNIRYLVPDAVRHYIEERGLYEQT